MHEEKLALACKKGNELAQRELYDRYSDAIYGICYRYAHNTSEADDFFQECFILILKKIKKFNYQGEGSLKAWLVRLSINNCISILRKKKIKTEINHIDFEELSEDNASTEYYAENKHDLVSNSNFTQKELLNELQILPEKFRMVFNLYVIEELKHKEIAELLNIKEKTSKTRLFRAKQMLQKQLYAKYVITKTV